ncbi:uncharacterized protein [Amphiura filiformis]|uniref:uncharacterized protein n=1 Tax=Amphiura filiformis TaxID=82378 RepID=UPI003B20E840
MAMYLRWGFLLVAVLVVTPTVNSECSVGQEVANRSGYLYTITIVLVDNVISCDGIITSWQFWPKNSFSFKALVLRQLADGNPSSWTIIGTNDIPVSDVVPNQKSTYIVPVGDRIEVQNGDVIGIAQYHVNPLIAAGSSYFHGSTGSGTLLHVAINAQTSNYLTNGEIFSLTPGSTISTVTSQSIGGAAEPLQVSLSANVEPGCSVGQQVVNRGGILSNVRIAMVLIDNTVSCNGVIASWQYWPKQSFPFKAIVFRQV